MQSGVITKHTANVNNDGGFTLDGSLKPEDVKRYLLYWDSIIYPVVNGLGPNLSSIPELAFLESNDILILEEVSIAIQGDPSEYGMVVAGMPLQLMPIILAEAQAKIATTKLSKGEVWSIAQTGDFFAMPPTEPIDINTLEFSLYNCLPVPGENVSYEDIINFRINNKKMLFSLQKQLESYRKKVAESEEPLRELALAKKELISIISDISSLMESKKWNFNFESFKSYLEISENSLATSGLGALGAAGINLPPELGAAAGYLTSLGMNVAHRAIQGHNRVPDALRDYLYLYNATTEKII